MEEVVAMGLSWCPWPGGGDHGLVEVAIGWRLWPWACHCGHGPVDMADGGVGCPHGVLDRCPHPVSPGSPLQFYVDAINPRHVSAYGPGLSHGMVNKPCTFTIVTKDAGEGELVATSVTKEVWDGLGDLQS